MHLCVVRVVCRAALGQFVQQALRHDVQRLDTSIGTRAPRFRHTCRKLIFVFHGGAGRRRGGLL